MINKNSIEKVIEEIVTFIASLVITVSVFGAILIIVAAIGE